MAISQPIVSWYLEQDFDHVAISFDDHLVDAVEISLSKSRIEAEFYAENHSDRLWNLLRSQIEEDRQRGLYPTFSEVGFGFKRLFWNPKYFPSGVSKYDRRSRLRLRSRIQVLKSIQNMNSLQYEALSVLACKLSGAAHFCMTPNDDFGIDFFAVIPSIGRTHLFSGGSGPLRIVGQCKMYERGVERAVIEPFIIALGRVHQRSTLLKDLIPNWFLTERGPIIGWFVAHNGLQTKAKEYANNFGIVHSDSRDLAEIVTMSRAWQPSDGINAPVELMRREIDEILSP
ncbi:MAG: hypothetical protein OXG49_10840 [Chloroflexi bacterium]|nr:hypothetical protein [Chloroflexota bacterium]